MIQSKILKSLRFVKDEKEVPFDGRYAIFTPNAVDFDVTIYDGDYAEREAELFKSSETIDMELVAIELREFQAFPLEVKKRFEEMCEEHQGYDIPKTFFGEAYHLFTEGESAIEKWWKTFEAQWAREVQNAKKELGISPRLPVYVVDILLGMTQEEYIALSRERREDDELYFVTHTDPEEVN